MRLCDRDIYQHLQDGKIKIDPTPSYDQISGVTVDIRLGNKFRVFEDHQGKMNLNVLQTQGQCLVVSQFTLVADTTRGNRPSFSAGADHQLSQALYQHFIQTLQDNGVMCESGQFAADMQVSLQNDGPVTFLLSA